MTDQESNASDNEAGFDLTVRFKDGDAVKISVSGYTDTRNAIAALARVGKPEYLTPLWNGLVSDDWEEDWDDPEDD